MDIVLFGIQGSGKGTLGKAIAEKYDFVIFETGGELRKLTQLDTPLAKKVKSIIEAGHLVPTEVVMEIIENFMHNLPAGKNVLIDGIPRKVDQAEAFNALMKKVSRNFMGILIDVPKEVSLERLLTRRLCQNCKTVYPAAYTKETCEKDGGKLITRTDDNPDAIKTRIDAFYNETMPAIENYKQSGLMIVMDGNCPIEEAAQRIFQIIDEKKLAA